MREALVDPQARLLNHAEFVYSPGDRALAKRLFEGLGLRVLDPQTDPIPDIIGPAAAPYLIVFLDPANDDPFDNVFYASEVPPAQWAYEERLREAMAADEKLAAARDACHAEREALPQAATHLGIAFPSAEAVDRAMQRLGADAALEGRVHLSQVYRPAEPGAVDDRVVQAFVRTDLCSNGLLVFGQRFELQVRLDL